MKKFKSLTMNRLRSLTKGRKLYGLFDVMIAIPGEAKF